MDAVSEYKINKDINVVIHNTGLVEYLPPLLIKSRCIFDLTLFPFDLQKCLLEFLSWTANDKQINITDIENNDFLQYYSINGEWDLLSIKCSFYFLY